MKNYTILGALVVALSAQYVALARGEGGAFAGALGGSLMGTVVGSAMTNNRSSDRAEQQAEQLRIDQERQRVNQLEREMDRRDMERRLADTHTKEGNHTLLMVLVAVVIVLLFGVMALGILVLRNKP